jgi:branched-subunit amino acid transport protein
MKEPHELWHHEETLIDQRMTWSLASQALLFAGFGWIDKGNVELAAVARILSYVGLVTSSFILIGILAAISAQIVLMKNSGQFYVWLPATIAGWVAVVGIPFTFIVAWIAVLCKFAA